MMVYEDGRRMDLVSTLPNGQKVATSWREGERFHLPAQHAQADAHRELVRERLTVMRGQDRGLRVPGMEHVVESYRRLNEELKP